MRDETAFTFPIVIYPSEDEEGGAFTAHCLNMDLIADDDTVEGAVSKLLETIEAAFEAGRRHRANPFRDAPKEYWDKLAQARPLAREPLEQIVFAANLRSASFPERAIDVETQCDLRQLALA
jgi:hypothetical protein